MTRDDRGRPHDESSDTDGPIDFSALRRTSARPADARAADAAGAPDRWEALARRIEAAAAPELARRAAHARRAGPASAPDLLFTIARAARPALLAVAASLVFALAVARSVGGSASSPADQSVATVAEASADEVSVARALSVDEPAATWIMQQRAPNADDMARLVDPEAAR